LTVQGFIGGKQVTLQINKSAVGSAHLPKTLTLVPNANADGKQVVTSGIKVVTAAAAAAATPKTEAAAATKQTPPPTTSHSNIPDD
jgi:ethanolamine utilization microcompartment shell protein EutS